METKQTDVPLAPSAPATQDGFTHPRSELRRARAEDAASGRRFGNNHRRRFNGDSRDGLQTRERRGRRSNADGCCGCGRRRGGTTAASESCCLGAAEVILEIVVCATGSTIHAICAVGGINELSWLRGSASCAFDGTLASTCRGGASLGAARGGSAALRWGCPAGSSSVPSFSHRGIVGTTNEAGSRAGIGQYSRQRSLSPGGRQAGRHPGFVSAAMERRPSSVRENTEMRKMRVIPGRARGSQAMLR